MSPLEEYLLWLMLGAVGLLLAGIGLIVAVAMKVRRR